MDETMNVVEKAKLTKGETVIGALAIVGGTCVVALASKGIVALAKRFGKKEESTEVTEESNDISEE